MYDQATCGPPDVIVAKSFVILYGSIPYAMGMMAVNIVAAAIHTLIVIQDACVAFWNSRCLMGLPTFVVTLGAGLCVTVLPDLFIAATSPIFWLGIEAVAVVGLLSPYDGMRIIDKVERVWHRNATYRDDVRHRSYDDTCDRFVRRDDHSFPVDVSGYLAELSLRVLFLAVCLQRRGNRQDTVNTPNGPLPRYEEVPAPARQPNPVAQPASA